jgi:arsenite-transporting ATPase
MAKVQRLLRPGGTGVRQVFFAGKGGVGKTTMACLTAVHAAREGYRTLLITTDPAGHIGSVLGKIVGDQVAPVDGVPGLSAAKIDQKQATEDYKRGILDDARAKFDEDTVRSMTEELASPCTEEMAAFQRFIDLSRSEGFDVIVFDTAPTGHTLRLLELPMDWSDQIRLKAGVGSGMSAADRTQKERFDQAVSMMQLRHVPRKHTDPGGVSGVSGAGIHRRGNTACCGESAHRGGAGDDSLFPEAQTDAAEIPG